LGRVGGAVRIGADEAFIFDNVRARHSKLSEVDFRKFLIGEEVRDWISTPTNWVYYPYADHSREPAKREFWTLRTVLRERATFQGVMADAGLDWTDYMQYTASTYKTNLSITLLLSQHIITSPSTMAAGYLIALRRW
jgi:hypothetical protein